MESPVKVIDKLKKKKSYSFHVYDIDNFVIQSNSHKIIDKGEARAITTPVFKNLQQNYYSFKQEENQHENSLDAVLMKKRGNCIPVISKFVYEEDKNDQDTSANPLNEKKSECEKELSNTVSEDSSDVYIITKFLGKYR